jgi:hypothetical protein
MNDHDHHERDLEGDMAPASFHPTDEWWRTFLAELDPAGIAKLRAGRMSLTVMGRDGVETAPLVAPAWLFEDPPPPVA